MCFRATPGPTPGRAQLVTAEGERSNLFFRCRAAESGVGGGCLTTVCCGVTRRRGVFQGR